MEQKVRETRDVRFWENVMYKSWKKGHGKDEMERQVEVENLFPSMEPIVDVDAGDTTRPVSGSHIDIEGVQEEVVDKDGEVDESEGDELQGGQQVQEKERDPTIAPYHELQKNSSPPPRNFKKLLEEQMKGTEMRNVDPAWEGRLRPRKGASPVLHFSQANSVPKDRPPPLPDEPTSRDEALKSKDAKEWHEAMEKEMDAMKDHGVWKLVDLPEGRKAIGVKWVFKVKVKEDGSIERFKARLTAKGFAQRAGEDYGDIYAPTGKSTTSRAFLATAAVKGWHVHQMDVNNAFLNGRLVEEVYMQQPDG